MAGWAFQGVLNVGIQIVLLVFAGWCFARFRLLNSEQFMGQINVLVLRLAFPSLTIYLLGIKVDLSDAEAWKSLGSYVLWVGIVQAAITAYAWFSPGRKTGEAALLNLVLTANNTVIVGLPVMQATFPDVGSRLSLLSAFVLFLQVIPFSITAFEIDKWVQLDEQRLHAAAAAAVEVSEPPPTPTRELSGRWVQRPDASGVGGDGDGDGGGDDSYGGSAHDGKLADGEHGEGSGGGVSGEAELVAVGGGGGSLVVRRSSGSNGSRGRSGVRKTGSRRTSRRHGGGGGGSSGHLIGTVGRGWAPATPSESPAVSSRTSSVVSCTEEGVARPGGDAGGVGGRLELPGPEAGAEAAAAVEARNEAPLAPQSPCGLTPAAAIAAAVTPMSAVALGLVASAAPVPAAADVVLLPPPPRPLPPAPGSAAQAQLDRAASGGGGNSGDQQDNPLSDASVGGGASHVISPFAAAAAAAGPVSPSVEAASSFATTAPATAAGTATAAVRSTTGSGRGTKGSSSPSTGCKGPTPPSAQTAVQVTATAYRSSSGPVPSAAAAAPTTRASAGALAVVRHGLRFRGGGNIDVASYRKAKTAAAAGGNGGSRGSPVVDGPTGHSKPLYGNSSPNEPAIQRQSFPVHWPPVVALEASVSDVRQEQQQARTPYRGAIAGGGGGGCTKSNVSAPLGRGSSRLLSPLALACSDLPVPQAIALARSTATGPFARRTYANDGSTAGASPSTAAAAADKTASAATAKAAPSKAVVVEASTTFTIPSSSRPLNLERAPSSPPPPPLPPPPPGQQQQLERSSVVIAVRRRGGVTAVVGGWLRRQLQQHRRGVVIAWIVLKNPLLWSLFVALAINLSGLRTLLLPTSPRYRPELGWVAGALAWSSGITVPVSLFSNGVWLYGKKFGRRTMVKACGLQALKLLLLAPLQLACAAACGLPGPAAISILLLQLCPVASTSFVIASQYGTGTELVTGVTILGTLLLVPAVLLGLMLPKAWGLYDFTVSSS